MPASPNSARRRFRAPRLAVGITIAVTLILWGRLIPQLLDRRRAEQVFEGVMAGNPSLVQMPASLLTFLGSASWVGKGCVSTLVDTSGKDAATVFGRCPSGATLEMKLVGLRGQQMAPRIMLLQVWRSGDVPVGTAPDAEYRGD